jgi:8-oxo-dGTP pyrophosphatase MutT (NUDIX family)
MIHKVGFALIRNDRILLCRPRRSTAWILPGGKMERGETEMDCLLRELTEELGAVQPVNPVKLGTYDSFTAGDPPKPIRIELYGGELSGDPRPCAEIAELVWYDGGAPSRLAPSLRELILPDLVRRKLLRWP